jgi:hypothetical protein
VKVEGDVVEGSLPVVADGDVLHIEDRFVGFVMGMRVHIAYLRASTIRVTLYFINSI